jgi:uncharacterized alpha-E superfamily protein
MDKDNKALVQAVLNEARLKPRSLVDKMEKVKAIVGDLIEKGHDIDQIRSHPSLQGYHPKRIEKAIDYHMDTPGASEGR